jgi:predicted nuclease of predicted toxin-antitoxin system
VLWARSVAPGSADTAVLDLAVRELRVLLTFDKDFGELAWRARLPASCGIILLRIPMPPGARAA